MFAVKPLNVGCWKTVLHILPLPPYSKEHLLRNDAMSEISVAYKNETLNHFRLTGGSARRE